MKLAPGLFLLICRLLMVSTSEDLTPSDETTLFPSSHAPLNNSANPSDIQKQDKTDAAQVKSYGMVPNYYPQGPPAIPVPLPIQIQGGPLMLPSGVQQPAYLQQPMQPLYPQPFYQQAGHKSDNLQPQQQQPVLVQVPNNEASRQNNQFSAFVSENQNNAMAVAASNIEPVVVAASGDGLSNHKSASLDIDVHLENPSNLIGMGFNSLASDSWPHPTPELPKIVQLDVKCEKNLMRVSIDFDRPFNGIIFSKGHYKSANCIHLRPNLGRHSVSFDVPVNGCGVQGNSLNGIYGRDSLSVGGSYFENTIVVQYDPEVQEVWDQARRLRCSWHDQYEKSVIFRPFAVDMLDVVRADFAGDNVGCWMQIQSGKGPWAEEVSGIVKIGQQMTMVLAIKDDENKFDMLVRNCVAHDGHGERPSIQLVDNQGCVVRPKIMSKFTKLKNFERSASILSYAYFQAFKFPDSMEVYFQCTIQICRQQCPEQCSQTTENDLSGSLNSFAVPFTFGKGRPRDERDVSGNIDDDEDGDETEVGVKRFIQVISAGDFAFSLENATNSATVVYPTIQDESGYVCMSTAGFAATLILLLSLLIIASLLCTFLCIRQYTLSQNDGNLPSFIKKSMR